MYLSRIALEVERRETKKALIYPSLLHGAIEQSFEGERQRRLWRIDTLKDNVYLLLLSADKPDFTNLNAQFGFKDNLTKGESRDYGDLITKLHVGQRWHFRLKANPTKSASSVQNKCARGKVIAHVSAERQKEWLLNRSSKNGFCLNEEDFTVVNTHWYKFKKQKNINGEVIFRTATFEGVLTIVDVDMFKDALVQGIGRAKAYGCGLLTIAPFNGGKNDR
ncbi:MAG: type I-E CRISPR-associated protein Cas6/Cse3/CasE [Negativicutes bacterium]|nr:type I-E CRISPR-associated protein Cas6/Cse3/CasE [Negativicutes bacterium]